MRILWLADFYPPIIGGLELHVQMIARELSSRGHSVSVATIWHEGTPDFELDQGVRVYRLNGLAQRFTNYYSDTHRRFHPTAPDPVILFNLLKIIKVEKPQIVIASGWILYSFLPIKAQVKAKLFIIHHDYAFICPKRVLYKDDHVCSGPGLAKCYSCATHHYGIAKGLAINTSFRFFSLFHGLIDHHIAISHFVANAILSSNKIPASSFHIMPMPIPDEFFDDYGPTHIDSGKLPINEKFILFVGGLTKHKGLNVLLDAYHGLESKAKLILIGTEWPDSPSTYPDNVIIIKDAPHNLVMEAFFRCSFSVIPSVWAEPFGQVAVEAMAMSKAVIASAHGGLRDIVIDQKTGILVEPGNVFQLHEEMKRLLDNPSYCQQLGFAGYVRAKQLFTLTNVTDQLEFVFKDVLSISSS